VKSIFFIMFLFAVGFGVGPQFVRGIATDGAPQALFAVVVSVLCLLGVYIAAIVSGYGPGLAAGLLAGSQTISASIGLATDAINTSGMTPEQAQAELDLIPVAYAITYLFGTVGTGWILVFFGPKLLGVDIAAECARYEREMSVGRARVGLHERPAQAGTSRLPRQEGGKAGRPDRRAGRAGRCTGRAHLRRRAPQRRHHRRGHARHCAKAATSSPSPGGARFS
jgi:putative transport protein